MGDELASEDLGFPTPYAFCQPQEDVLDLPECHCDFARAFSLSLPTNGDRPGVVDVVVNEGGLPFIYGEGSVGLRGRSTDVGSD